MSATDILAERRQCCADVCHGCEVALPLAWAEDLAYHTPHDGAGKFRCDAFKIHLRARAEAGEVEMSDDREQLEGFDCSAGFCGGLGK